MNEVRIDKWMWATRIFKTRTIAAEACKKNRVMINGVNVKPSRMIKVGEVIQVRKPPITFSFKVLDLTERRMGAKLVPDYLENVTTPDQFLRNCCVKGFYFQLSHLQVQFTTGFNTFGVTCQYNRNFYCYRFAV